ncbi:MAG TPA: DUF503 domain-containing protein [Pseudomonadales bacterium]
MSIAALRIDFYLSGCRSLKEKRQRLNGIRERFGRAHNVAVCESDHQDLLQRAQWTFIAAAASREVVDRALTDIERNIQALVDAELVNVWREWLD